MSILVWYLVLFAPQLVIGAAIGWWIGHRPGDEPAGGGESALREDELRLALSRLKLLTDSVQEDVREHAQKVDTSSRELQDISAKGEGADPQSALDAIGPIVKANEDLQRRLQETEQRLAEQAEQLDKQTTEARTDPLTGLLNRRGLESRLPPLYDAFEKSGQSFCFTILDIDHFKKFNDDYGHDVGDAVLCDVVRVLGDAVRRQDIVARFGGEEFVVLSPDTELHDAGQLLERVRTAVEDNIVRDNGRELKVTVSLGVAEAGKENWAALTKRADVALYAAKEAGRNRAYYHDGEGTQPVVGRERAAVVESDADELDQLPDRQDFAAELERRIGESAKADATSLVVLEIDRLEEISAGHGDETGTLVRRGIAAFLKQIMRELDVVARSEQDGFCLLLDDCRLDDASRVAERIRLAAGRTPFRTEGVELQLTLSAGVTSAQPGESADALLDRAHLALARSIQSGGNCSSVERPTDDPADPAATPVDAQEQPSEPVAAG